MISEILRTISLCVLAAAPAASPEQPSARAASDWADRLRPFLVNLPDARASAGACVIDLTTSRVVFEHQADLPMIPASASKVLVMAAAWDQLGPKFRFETLLIREGENLCIIGSGDPAIGDARLHRQRGESSLAVFEAWADALVRQGLTKIPGHLIIDESIFDEQRLHPTWEAQDLNKWYAAPVGALNFNDNCVDITVAPAAETGRPVVVTFEPPSSLIRIVNRCTTGQGASPILHHEFSSLEYVITGACSKKWPFGSVSFPDPGLLFADTFRNVFVSRGVMLDGSILRSRVRRADGSLPGGYAILARHATDLSDVLSRIGKDSQNLFAECLIKRLGYEWSRRRGEEAAVGSWRNGCDAVTAWLRETGDFQCADSPPGTLNMTGFRIVDGSGLSRENRCTARQLACALARMNRHAHGEVFRASLSLAGFDGSLRRRLRDAPGLVYAKTGTMRGVRALTGYVMAQPQSPDRDLRAVSIEGADSTEPSQARFAFAVLFNGYHGSSTPYREIQDRFCRALLTESP